MCSLSGFQFHKGTIRTINIFHTIAFLRYFNSIKVQLELSKQKSYHSNRLFQFHKGTIRTFLREERAQAKRVFQFHKGTIRTGSAKMKFTADTLFQFHKGTIRTR